MKSYSLGKVTSLHSTAQVLTIHKKLKIHEKKHNNQKTQKSNPNASKLALAKKRQKSHKSLNANEHLFVNIVDMCAYYM